MSTPHVIASSSGHPSHSVSSNNGIVGGHYKVGKKIGEGSFGVVFEGMFYRPLSLLLDLLLAMPRSRARRSLPTTAQGRHILLQ